MARGKSRQAPLRARDPVDQRRPFHQLDGTVEALACCFDPASEPQEARDVAELVQNIGEKSNQEQIKAISSLIQAHRQLRIASGNLAALVLDRTEDVDVRVTAVTALAEMDFDFTGRHQAVAEIARDGEEPDALRVRVIYALAATVRNDDAGALSEIIVARHRSACTAARPTTAGLRPLSQAINRGHANG